MTNITNPYLSAKAVAKKKTDIPVVLVCAIFAAATVSATITMFSQGKTLSGVMGIFLFAALITPVFRILRHAYRRACARRIAGALLPLTEESLTFDQLGTVLSSSKALEQLRSLIGTGYLQNLQINAATRTVALYTPEGTFVQWICPGCGAKNSGRRGSAPRCTYCGQPYAKGQPSPRRSRQQENGQFLRHAGAYSTIFKHRQLCANANALASLSADERVLILFSNLRRRISYYFQIRMRQDAPRIFHSG